MSATILVVDDQPENRKILSLLLAPMGLTVTEAADGEQALRVCAASPPDVVLLDVLMPVMEGLEALKRLKASPQTEQIPVIMLTGFENKELLTECIRSGAEDYIVKPFQREFLLARIQSSLRKKELYDVRTQLMSQMTSEVEGLKYGIANAVRESSDAQRSVIFALACLAEQRDPETGEHLERVQGYVEVLCRAIAQHPAYSCLVTDSFIRNLPSASILHDIGKVGVPDAVLQKPGALTPEERVQMQYHAELGARTLNRVSVQFPNNEFVMLGAEIAYTHHERWDGGGYPRKFSGTDIPLSGRIVAIADVYDALRSRRCYKAAMPHEKAVSIITEEAGKHFDPALIEVFQATAHIFNAVYQSLPDTSGEYTYAEAI